MRVCIVGAGAIGSYLAGNLSLAGHDVSVVARGVNLRAIQHDGLTLRQGADKIQARPTATDDARTLGPQDVVMVCVKSTALASIVESLAPLVGPETLVVFPQNGVPWWYPVCIPARVPTPPHLQIFSLARRFLGAMREDQVIGGVIFSANEVESPGVTINHSPTHNELKVGGLTGSESDSAALCALRSDLTRAGIASPAVKDIRTEMWLKLVGNASGSTIAMVCGNPRAISEDPDVQEIFIRAARECVAIAHAHGHNIDGRFDPIEWCRRRGPHKPSLLQDYERGKRMGVAEIALGPVAFARAAGVATPTLDVIAAVAARMAADKGLFERRADIDEKTDDPWISLD